MAELPGLGKHCSFTPLGSSSGCGYLDFLPFKCENCQKIFCEEHRFPHTHNCTVQYDKVIPTCPMCNQIIYVKQGADVNVEVNKHINAGCPTVQKPEIRSFGCTVKNCKVKELQRISCTQCKKDFCSSHKYPTSHDCPKVVLQPKQHTPGKVELPTEPSFWDLVSERMSNVMKSFSESDNPRARQTALLNMKQRATGSNNIPQERRYYLEVLFPMDSKIQPKMMFFDMNSVLGLILDQIADAGRIKNENNKTDAKKLQLISVKSGEPFVLKQQLKNCPGLSSGDTILLEYVKT
jgi:predicted nucleic acid binding AN1-type Zn finger protein